MKIPQRLELKIKSYLRLIKRALQHETKENSQMIRTYLRYSQGEASKEEMRKANLQFKSFLKTIGLGVLAVLPFAPVTIPAMVKLAKEFDIDLIPSYLKEENKDQ